MAISPMPSIYYELASVRARSHEHKLCPRVRNTVSQPVFVVLCKFHSPAEDHIIPLCCIEKTKCYLSTTVRKKDKLCACMNRQRYGHIHDLNRMILLLFDPQSHLLFDLTGRRALREFVQCSN